MIASTDVPVRRFWRRGERRCRRGSRESILCIEIEKPDFVGLFSLENGSGLRLSVPGRRAFAPAIAVQNCSVQFCRTLSRLLNPSLSAKIKNPTRSRVLYFGGEGGIRTLGARKRTPDFESGTIDHSATSPGARILYDYSTYGRYRRLTLSTSWRREVVIATMPGRENPTRHRRRVAAWHLFATRVRVGPRSRVGRIACRHSQ